MAGITVSGMGSGLDVNSIVSQLISAEKTPATKRLDSQEARLQAQLTALGSFKGAVSELQRAVQGLNAASKFDAVSASVGNAELLGASVSAAAKPGSYSIEVEQLAQAQKLASGAHASVDSVVGTGTLSFRFGTYSADGNTFSVNPDRETKTITVDASNNTLSGLRDAINQADIGVSASIVNDGSGYRLVLGAKDSGAKNALEVTGIAGLSYSAGSKELTQTVEAQDAKLTVDGLAITSAGNSVAGAIPGVTLNLKSAKPGAPTSLAVAADSSAATKGVQAFVDAYNKFMEFASKATAVNAKTGERGALVGDSSVRAMLAEMRRQVTAVVPGATGQVKALIDIGVSTNRDGTLKLDGTKLQQALGDDAAGVAALFAKVGATSDPKLAYGTHASKTRPGSYAVEVTQVPASYSGTLGSVTGDVTLAGNESFTVKVDGVGSGPITLDAGTYTTAQLASHLQQKINGDAAISAGGTSVTVAYDSDNQRLLLTSAKFAGKASVEFSAVANAGALGIVDGQALVTAAGKIGGVVAEGDGIRLSAKTGDAEGLSVDVLGGATGARGTVSLSGGFAAAMDTLLDGFLKKDGKFDTRTQTLSDEVGSIQEQRTDLAERLTRLEARYRKQFIALDKAMSQLNATSGFLQQQIDAWSGKGKQ